MDESTFDRTHLLRLLSLLEGELQARELVIALLKSERVKRLINYRRNDPIEALTRDSLAVFGSQSAFDEKELRRVFVVLLKGIDWFIRRQRQQCNSLLGRIAELERQRWNDVMSGRLDDSELARTKDELRREKERQRLMIGCLLEERKALIVKLIEEKTRNEELKVLLERERMRVVDMVSGVEEESSRSLAMEAELERQSTLFESERKALNERLLASQRHIQQLTVENERLKEIKSIRAQTITTQHPTIHNAPLVSRVVDSHSYATVNKATIPTPPNQTPPPPPPPATLSTTSTLTTTTSLPATQQSTTMSSNTYSNVSCCESKTMQGTTTTVSSAKVQHSTVVRPMTATTAMTTVSSSESQVQWNKRTPTVAGGKGQPPPVPPNKPTIKPIKPKQPNTTTTSSSTTGNNTTTTSGETVGAVSGQSGSGVNNASQQVDVLCQEFHELYRSMVTNN